MKSEILFIFYAKNGLGNLILQFGILTVRLTTHFWLIKMISIDLIGLEIFIFKIDHLVILTSLVKFGWFCGLL